MDGLELAASFFKHCLMEGKHKVLLSQIEEHLAANQVAVKKTTLERWFRLPITKQETFMGQIIITYRLSFLENDILNTISEQKATYRPEFDMSVDFLIKLIRIACFPPGKGIKEGGTIKVTEAFLAKIKSRTKEARDLERKNPLVPLGFSLEDDYEQFLIDYAQAKGVSIPELKKKHSERNVQNRTFQGRRGPIKK